MTLQARPKVIKPEHEFFEKTISQVSSAFLGLSHELLFTSRALHHYKKKVETDFKPERPVKLLTFLLDHFDYKYVDGELSNFVEKMTDLSNLCEQFFLLNFAKAEFFLSKIQPTFDKDFFGLQFEYTEPEFWFGNLTFQDFIKFNTACFNEIRRSRNDLVHNGGYVTATYLQERDNGLKTDKARGIDSSFISVLADFDRLEPYKDLTFKEPIKKRLQLPMGSKLPYDEYYLAFVQMVLIERIFLKCGIYHFFVQKEKTLHPMGKGFEFWTFKEFPTE